MIYYSYMTHELIVEFDKHDAPDLFGEHNANIAYIEDQLGVVILDRGNTLTVSGSKDALDKVKQVLDTLLEKLDIKGSIKTSDIDTALRFIDHEPALDKKAKKAAGKKHGDIVIKTKKKTIVPRSPNQAVYLKSIMDKEMVFGLGPAGTGKTHLAVAAGVSMYLSGQVERLIFTRPAVEAGENLGFLPGDLQEKVDPYLRPIYDAMQDMLPQDFIMKKMEEGDFEVAPLAFMRGRTLSNAFVILDEAQNTTTTQMKMFLTRMGEASRMVITGDLSQTDLPSGHISGLRDATDTLEGLAEIDFHRFNIEDVVRHKLVGKIIQAYDNRA